MALQIADTSFLYAIFNAGDRFHTAAREAALRREPIIIPSEVWAEAIGVMHRRMGFQVTVAVKKWVETQHDIRLGFSAEREQRLAWTLFVRHAGRLSFVDAMGLAWARLEGASLLSFDEHQLKAAAE